MDYVGEATKQYGKIINTSCQFAYSFFLTFSYILLAYRFCQYVSHIYYIYLYISTVPLSREPRGLRIYSRMESWWILPSGLECLGGGQGVPSCPVGLSALRPKCVPSALWSSAAGLWGKNKGEGWGARLWCQSRPCGVQQAAPRALASSPGQPSKIRPPNPYRGGTGTTGVSPGSRQAGLLEAGPGMRANTRTCRTEQGRAGRLVPQHPKGILNTGHI